MWEKGRNQGLLTLAYVETNSSQSTGACKQVGKDTTGSWRVVTGTMFVLTYNPGPQLTHLLKRHLKQLMLILKVSLKPFSSVFGLLGLSSPPRSQHWTLDRWAPCSVDRWASRAALCPDVGSCWRSLIIALLRYCTFCSLLTNGCASTAVYKWEEPCFWNPPLLERGLVATMDISTSSVSVVCPQKDLGWFGNKNKIQWFVSKTALLSFHHQQLMILKD